MLRLLFKLSATALCFASSVGAFQSASRHVGGRAGTSLRMAPRYDPMEQRWFPGDDEDAIGYPPIGSLIRQGPKAFLSRVTNGDGYEQGVYKMMAQEGWDRNEAQGNMDAYIENPNDWVFQKSAEKNGAPKYDYANANTDKKQVALTSVWAGVVFWYITILAQKIIETNAGTSSSGSILPFL